MFAGAAYTRGMAGRPGPARRFDVGQALEAATLVFWEHGYDATSIALLTERMKINPPSLYAAFGDKQHLFTAVIAHYNDTHGRFMADAFAEEGTAWGLVRRLLEEAAAHYTDPRFPGGCLVISATTNYSPGSREVAAELRRMRNANVDALAARIEAGVQAGELPPDEDPKALARYYCAVIQGMSQQARDGATTTEVQDIARRALRTWPGHLTADVLLAT